MISENHLMNAILSGELSPHREEAKASTAEQFAKAHGAEVMNWGMNSTYRAVRVDSVTYLWVRLTGKYDGWAYGGEEQ